MRMNWNEEEIREAKIMFEVESIWHVSSPDRSGLAMGTLNNQLINTHIFT